MTANPNPATVPNPGSDEAVRLGCLCAVWDNCRGAGYMGQPNVFVMTDRCPLHNREQRRRGVLPAGHPVDEEDRSHESR